MRAEVFRRTERRPIPPPPPVTFKRQVAPCCGLVTATPSGTVQHPGCGGIEATLTAEDEAEAEVIREATGFNAAPRRQAALETALARRKVSIEDIMAEYEKALRGEDA